MRIDLSELIERGESPLLLVEKRTGVIYTWFAQGQDIERRVHEGYVVPVGDSVIRAQLAHIHVGCGGTLTDADMDHLDSVFRVAGVPFVVDRAYWAGSTENAVWVRFPAYSEQLPIEGSRLAKWRPLWGKRAIFVWWNCETESEHEQRLQQEARDSAEDETEGQYLFQHLH